MAILKQQLKPISSLETIIEGLKNNVYFMNIIKEATEAPDNPYTREEKEELLRKQQLNQLTLPEAERLRTILLEDLQNAHRLIAIVALILALIGIGALIASLQQKGN